MQSGAQVVSRAGYLLGLGIAGLSTLVLGAFFLHSALGGGGVPLIFADPLAPPETSSPRHTLDCVRDEVNRATAIIIPAAEKHFATPGLFQSAETREGAAIARAHIDRALRCLDLSAIPPSSRSKIGTERVLMLSEVLERLAPATPPEAGAGPLPDSWTYPKSEIRIARMTSGPRAGEYLFTADTVERVPAFYTAVANRPGQDRFDFYKFYSFSPGDLMPPKWYGLVRQLPDWALAEYLDQAGWQWAGYIAVWLAALGASAGLVLLPRRLGHRKRLPAAARRLLAPFGILIVMWFAGWMMAELNITGGPFAVADAAFTGAMYTATAWLAAAAALSLADWLANASGLRPRSIDAGMLHLALRLVGLAAGAGVLAYGASELGLPLIGVVAGLGVGGLAIALAAQPTLENLIGGFMIYADRPVRVGDQCKFGDISGIVEEIGIRSTRIRAADRSLITIPNGDFSKQRLTNADRRDRLVINGRIGLRYGTTQAQLRQVVEETAKFFERHPRIDETESSLRLAEFGAISLDLDLIAQLSTRDKNDIPPLRQEILLAIAGIVETAGTDIVKRV